MSNRDFQDHGFTVPPSMPSFDWNKGAGRTTEYDESAYDPLDTVPDPALSANNPEPGKTMVIDDPERRLDGKPVQVVVGWLVGIDGKCKGIDYRLHSGYNRIGRGDNMDIVLSDERISREAAFVIFYDPLSNRFFANNGGGKCMSYVNRTPLMGTQPIGAFDRIQLAVDSGGKAEIISEMLFVPLCGERFSWAELEQKTKKDAE